MERIYAELEKLVRARLEDWPREPQGYHWPGYTYDHTLRVVKLATWMARRLDADVQIIRFAALLHDIRKDAGRDHAKVGAAEVRRILAGYDLAPHFVSAVAHAIECHSGDNTPEHPVENLCLGDADLIDANFGLVATWRFITIRSHGGQELGDTIEAMAEWLPKKDALTERLNTTLGHQIAARRSERMHWFCTRLLAAQIEGEDDDGLLWLARYVHNNAARGRLGEQLAVINCGEAGELPEAAEAVVKMLLAEAAGQQ
jgi:uncharacterized protein